MFPAKISQCFPTLKIYGETFLRMAILQAFELVYWKLS